jgi:nitronate monooxygenase
LREEDFPVKAGQHRWSADMSVVLTRSEDFCRRFGLRVPILLAPMAGACPPSLSIAVARAGGLGAGGALLWTPDEIVAWARDVRAGCNGGFQLNLWIPDAPPVRDRANEDRVRTFLADWGPAVPPEAGDATPPDFTAQCEALVASGAPIVSSIMGVFPADFVATLKARDVLWFATVTTVAEARAAVTAGADVVVAQGAEAGGHRGAFDPAEALRRQVGLFSLLPAIVDAVDVPVVATGGIADGRGVAAALALGASAVQIGTAFLRAPEAKTNAAWADAIATTAPEDTMVTRAFSGRAGRSIATRYVEAAAAETAPPPAPYPVQRGLTAAMRSKGGADRDIDRMQAWAGQSAGLAKAEPAEALVARWWDEAKAVLA